MAQPRGPSRPPATPRCARAASAIAAACGAPGGHAMHGGRSAGAMRLGAAGAMQTRSRAAGNPSPSPISPPPRGEAPSPGGEAPGRPRKGRSVVCGSAHQGGGLPSAHLGARSARKAPQKSPQTGSLEAASPTVAGRRAPAAGQLGTVSHSARISIWQPSGLFSALARCPCSGWSWLAEAAFRGCTAPCPVKVGETALERVPVRPQACACRPVHPVQPHRAEGGAA